MAISALPMDASPMSPLEQALELAGYGFHLFPLRKGKKTPAHTGWQDEATNNRQTISAWAEKTPGLNFGVYTGRYGHHGERALLVVDIDNKKGKNGGKALVALELDGNDFPPTMTSGTASGGRHLFYVVDEPVRQGVDVLGEGLDIRSAGGFVVAPGSVIDGKRYALETAGPFAAPADYVVAPAPAWLVEACGRPRPKTESREPLPGIDPKRARARGIEYLTMQAPEAIEGAGGDHTTFAVAARLKDLGVDEATALELMLEHWHGGCGWTSTDLAVKVANAYRYGTNAPGSDAPEALFEPVEIEPKPAAAKPGRYELLSVETLIGRAPPPWLVRGLLPAQGMGVVYGAPGSGKSFLVLDLAAAIARGIAWAGHRVRQGAVVYVALEGQMGPRVNAYLREQQLQPRDLSALHVIQHQGLNLLAENFGPVRQLIADIQAASVGRVAMVVVDTLNRSMPGGNENASEDMGRAIHCAGEISRALDCLCVFVHHSGKDATRGARGHSSLLGAADAELEVSRGADGGTRFLEATKVKDGEDGARFSFRLKSIDLGATRDHDPDADEYDRDSSCVVEALASVAGAPAGKRSRTLGKHAENAMRALREALDAMPFSPGNYENPRCTVEAWRDRFFSGWPIEEDLNADDRRKAIDRRRRAFEDAREALKARGLVEVNSEKSNFSEVRIVGQ